MDRVKDRENRDAEMDLPEALEEAWFEQDRTETTILYSGGNEYGATSTSQPGAGELPTEAWGILHYRTAEGDWIDVPLVEDEIVIGRTEQAHAALPWDKRVSRVHCLLVRTPGGCKLLDRGSENGTYVDDELAEERELFGGEIIRTGDTSLVFHVLSDPTVPVSHHMRTPNPAETVREFCFRMGTQRDAPKAADLNQDPLVGPILRGSREHRAIAATEAARMVSGVQATALDEVQSTALKRLLARLLRAKLPFDEDDLIVLLEGASAADGDYPTQSVVSAVEAFRREHACSSSLAAALTRLAGSMSGTDRKSEVLRERVQALKAMEPDGAFPLAHDRWGREVQEYLDTLGEGTRAAWHKLFQHARELGGNMDVPQAWSSEASRLVSEVGQVGFTAQLVQWMDNLDPGPAIDPRNRDVLVALVRHAGLVGGDDMAPHLAAIAKRGYERVPGYGPRSARIATAAVYALADLNADARDSAFKELESTVRLSLGRRTIRRVRKSA